jgi:hypothetical protein
MRWWWFLLAAVACKGGEGDAVGDDDDTVGDDDDTVGDDDDDAPWPNACVSIGPDAPNSGPLPDADVVSTFEGFETYVWLPERPRGLMVYFHGGATSDEVAQVEQAALFSMLHTEGFGVVATQRTLPGAGDSWDITRDLARNEDAARIERLLAKVRADNGLPESLPLATIGFSDGAIMSMAMAAIASDEGWPIIASFVHSGAYQNVAGPVPTMLFQPVNDPGQFPDPIVRDLQDAGIRAEIVEQPERLAVAEAFLRNGFWDLEQAQLAVDDLVAVGMVDANGARLVADQNIEQAINLYGANSTFEGVLLAETRMRVLWATHRFSAYSAEEECRFLLDSL